MPLLGVKEVILEPVDFPQRPLEDACGRQSALVSGQGWAVDVGLRRPRSFLPAVSALLTVLRL